MTENIKKYSGPALLENYALLLSIKRVGSENKSKLTKKFIGFSLYDKSFYIKDSSDNNNNMEIFQNKSIINFHDRLSKEEQMEYPDGYGFFILAGSKKIVIFVDNDCILKKWLRILNYYFYKIDIEEIDRNTSSYILDANNYDKLNEKRHGIISKSINDICLSMINNKYLVNPNKEVFNKNKFDLKENLFENHYNDDLNLSNLEIKFDNINNSINNVNSNMLDKNLSVNNLRKFKINPPSNDNNNLTNFTKQKIIDFPNLSPVYNKIYKKIIKKESTFDNIVFNNYEESTEKLNVGCFGNLKHNNFTTQNMNTIGSKNNVNHIDHKKQIMDYDRKIFKKDSLKDGSKIGITNKNEIEIEDYNFFKSNNEININEKESNFFNNFHNEKEIDKNDYSKYLKSHHKAKINFIFETKYEISSKRERSNSKLFQTSKEDSQNIIELINSKKELKEIQLNNPRNSREESYHNDYNFNTKYDQNSINSDIGNWELSNKIKNIKSFNTSLDVPPIFDSKTNNQSYNLSIDQNLHLKVNNDTEKINLENLHFGIDSQLKRKKIENCFIIENPLIINDIYLHEQKWTNGLETKRRKQLLKYFKYDNQKLDSTNFPDHVKKDKDSFIVTIPLLKNEKEEKNEQFSTGKVYRDNYDKADINRLDQLKIKLKQRETEEPIYLGKSKPHQRHSSSSNSYKDSHNREENTKINNNEMFNYYNNIDCYPDYDGIKNSKEILSNLDNIENPFKMNAKYESEQLHSKVFKEFLVENQTFNVSYHLNENETEIDNLSISNKKDKNSNINKNKNLFANGDVPNMIKSNCYSHKDKNLKEIDENDRIHLYNQDHHSPIVKTIKIDDKTQLVDNIHLEINEHQSVKDLKLSV